MIILGGGGRGAEPAYVVLIFCGFRALNLVIILSEITSAFCKYFSILIATFDQVEIDK
jgi:hypothetical protein